MSTAQHATVALSLCWLTTSPLVLGALASESASGSFPESKKGTGTFPVGDEAGWVGHFVRQMVGQNVTRMCHCARARARAQHSFS